MENLLAGILGAIIGAILTIIFTLADISDDCVKIHRTVLFGEPYVCAPLEVSDE